MIQICGILLRYVFFLFIQFDFKQLGVPPTIDTLFLAELQEMEGVVVGRNKYISRLSNWVTFASRLWKMSLANTYHCAHTTAFVSVTRHLSAKDENRFRLSRWCFFPGSSIIASSGHSWIFQIAIFSLLFSWVLISPRDTPVMFALGRFVHHALRQYEFTSILCE